MSDTIPGSSSDPPPSETQGEPRHAMLEKTSEHWMPYEMLRKEFGIRSRDFGPEPPAARQNVKRGYRIHVKWKNERHELVLIEYRQKEWKMGWLLLRTVPEAFLKGKQTIKLEKRFKEVVPLANLKAEGTESHIVSEFEVKRAVHRVFTNFIEEWTDISTIADFGSAIQGWLRGNNKYPLGGPGKDAYSFDARPPHDERAQADFYLPDHGDKHAPEGTWKKKNLLEKNFGRFEPAKDIGICWVLLTPRAAWVVTDPNEDQPRMVSFPLSEDTRSLNVEKEGLYEVLNSFMNDPRFAARFATMIVPAEDSVSVEEKLNKEEADFLVSKGPHEIWREYIHERLQSSKRPPGTGKRAHEKGSNSPPERSPKRQISVSSLLNDDHDVGKQGTG